MSIVPKLNSSPSSTTKVMKKPEPSRSSSAPADDDARVGVAVLQVVLPQQLAIERQPVGVVDVGALEEVEQPGLGGGDDVAQLRVGERPVADEVDGLDLGRVALVDLEHEVHAVAVELDDLGLDDGGKAALPAVDVEDALHVGLRLGAGEDGARLELDLVFSVSLSTSRLPSKATWLMTGFSTTVITTPAPSRSMRTSENRPVANRALMDWSTLPGS